MRFDPPLTEARLLRRYKRFLADVERDGERFTVHCPNTGAMLGCDTPGSPVWLSHSDRAGRKYPWTWEQVTVAGGVQVGIHSARANALVGEALEASAIDALAGYARIRPEVRYGEEKSRADFALQSHPSRPDAYLEVKNVTAVAEPGTAIFPDAVSARGARHLRELKGQVEAGRRGVLLFCVQRADVFRVRPADHIDPVYGRTLREAMAAGVEVLAWVARVTPETVSLEREVSVALD